MRPFSSTGSVADSTALALVLTGVFGAIYALVARLALDGFPYSGDEYSLALQAELFARGLLKAPAPEHVEWLRVDHVVLDTWIRSKYPPGAPALLALGARWGVAWLVTPIEAVAALLVVWDTTKRVLGARPALVALVAVGLAPLFAVEAASFYAHTATMLFLSIAFAAVAAWTRKAHDGWLGLAGVAIGCAFLTRPIDAMLFGVAMVWLRSPRAVILTAACALPFVAANLYYQKLQFGSLFTDGYHAYEPTFRALYGADTAANPLSLRHLVSGVQWWNHIDVYRAFVTEWTIPGTALVALVGAFAIGRDHPARPIRTFCLAVIATYAVALLVMISDPDDGPRCRYLSPIVVPVAVLAAAGWAPACEAIAARFGRLVQRILVVVAIVFALAQLAAFLQDRIPLVERRDGLYAAAGDRGISGVVIVRARYPSRYARNGPWFDGPVLYLSAPPSTSSDTVAAAFPGRSIWEAHEGDTWTFERVR